MSKYYKAEDVIREIEELQNCDNGWSDTYDKAQIIGVLDELPTIEVSEEVLKATKKFNCYTIADENAEMGMRTMIEPIVEVSGDCISREYLKSFEYINKGDFNSVETIRGWIDNAPSVVPQTQIETQNLNENSNGDAISREYVKGICEMMLDEEMLGHMLGYIEDAPSVVPTTEQSSMVGEWKRHPIPENRAWDVCTACGTGCRRRHYGFNEDGTEYVEQANYPFCPNCGAKMKV